MPTSRSFKLIIFPGSSSITLHGVFAAMLTCAFICILKVLAALSVSLGSMVVGFSSAYTSPALVSMKDRNITSFEVTDQSVSVWASWALLGVLCQVHDGV